MASSWMRGLFSLLAAFVFRALIVLPIFIVASWEVLDGASPDEGMGMIAVSITVFALVDAIITTSGWSPPPNSPRRPRSP